jgi:hypothetical protein
MIELSPPGLDEYAPFYSDYIQRASQRDDLHATLSLQLDEMHTALDPLNDI